MEITESQLATALEGFRVRVGSPVGMGTTSVEIAYADKTAASLYAKLSRMAEHDGEVVNADIPDPEVAAIAAIVAAMDRLDEETVLLGTDVHERVIRWAISRYLGPAASGGCPIAVVLGDGMHSCTLRRGHGGDHDYADNPDAD